MFTAGRKKCCFIKISKRILQSESKESVKLLLHLSRRKGYLKMRRWITVWEYCYTMLNVWLFWEEKKVRLLLMKFGMTVLGERKNTIILRSPSHRYQKHCSAFLHGTKHYICVKENEIRAIFLFEIFYYFYDHNV